jgi:hypothetical protein
MVIALPLLLLLAAGLFQIGLLTLHVIRFDDACGTAARRYVSGEMDEKDLTNAVWSALGPSQPYFEEGSIRLESPDKTSVAGQDLTDSYRQDIDDVSVFKKYLHNPLLNYSKGDWRITATYRSKPLLGFMFPHGIRLSTEVCVFHYRGGI